MSNVITLKDNNYNILCEENGITLYFFCPVFLYFFGFTGTLVLAVPMQVYHTGYTL